MRTKMTEAQMNEKIQLRLSERNKKADKLLESRWIKEPELGQGLEKMYEADKSKARNLAIALSLQENHLNSLTETQISTSFGHTPENVMRIIRLGYPNSVRGELFSEFAMQSANDSFYYLASAWSKTKRGATKGDTFHETQAYRYASEVEVDAVDEAVDGVVKTFTLTIPNAPVRKYTVRVLVEDTIVGVDDGAGNITGDDVTGSVDYNTGAVEITFGTAPANGTAVEIESNFVSEEPAMYDNVGSLELKLKDYQFRAKPHKLYTSISGMTDILLNTTLSIDTQEALITGGGEALKMSLDYGAIAEGYRASKKATEVTFDLNGAVGESEVDRAQAVGRAINKCSNKIYEKLGRGGVSKIMGGADAIDYLTLHKSFVPNTNVQAIGAHKVGTIKGNIDLYKVPSNLIPNDELVPLWKNEANPADVGLLCGSLIPLVSTEKLQYKDFRTEQGMAHFGDIKVMNSDYFQKLKLQNL